MILCGVDNGVELKGVYPLTFKLYTHLLYLFVYSLDVNPLTLAYIYLLHLLI
ncbi:hypothetical protein LDVICp109 [lymphocystis disease virus-China]|uniref:Uncharacterized protein n=1 Tax=lymphocystis disease virus-China TaxID=256729 RepID=Q678A3_9VIRU|nr:hypothetical protein LDVICp109 [lymphocystis disease virus-China]AAU10954.1 hypothetical protein [lymphocystis disease virus-China]